MLFHENLTGNSSCDTSKSLLCLFHPQQTERKTIETGSHLSKKRKKTQYKYTISSQRDTRSPTDIDLSKDRSKNNNTITTQDTSYDKTDSHWYTDTYIEKQIQTYTGTEQMRQFNYYMFVMTFAFIILFLNANICRSECL